jgi:hypothetical protein
MEAKPRKEIRLETLASTAVLIKELTPCFLPVIL